MWGIKFNNGGDMSQRMTVSVLYFLVKRMQPKESGSTFKKLEMYQNFNQENLYFLLPFLASFLQQESLNFSTIDTVG